MALLTIHIEDGRNEVREVSIGETLLQAMGDEAVHLQTPCGGTGRCGKCRVLASGALSQPGDVERDALGQDLEEGWRLACLATVQGDAEVTLSLEQDMNRIQSGGELPEFQWDPLFTSYGAAVDIGTTTLAARLYDRRGLRASATAVNPQRTFGADVISRIEKSMAGSGPELAQCIWESLSQLLKEMAEKAGIAPEQIDSAVITGNTTMLYLLTQRDTTCLSCAPFIADDLFGRFAEKGEIRIPGFEDLKIYLPACIGAFVGGDIATALLPSGIYKQEGTKLMVDIGTNGELALTHNGKMLCTSTAAGPVFEGAGISSGMQGGPGAIDKIQWENGAPKIHTIDNKPPVGICGSGIIDGMAVLVEQELVDETGAFEDLEELKLTEDISITQKDIRMIQLAKGAVCAGIMTLLDLAELEPDELEELQIAGGFGSYIDLHNAGRIGLYPAELEKKTRVLGNAALTGAAMLLLRKEYMDTIKEIAANSECVELSSNPVFVDNYMDCMEF